MGAPPKTKRPDSIDVAEFYRAVLKDYAAAYPDDQLEVIRDSKRVALELRSRGMGFFTLDLPEMGKVLDRALSEGRLPLTSLPVSRRRWKGSTIPRLFSGLWIRLFDRSGLLREDIDPTVVSFLRTLLYAGKKARLECAPKRLYSTIKEYYDVESRLPSATSRIWEDPDAVFDSSPSNRHALGAAESFRQGFFGHREVDLVRQSEPSTVHGSPQDVRGFADSRASLLAHVQRSAGCLVSSLGLFVPEEVEGKHGPGAVSERLFDGNKKYEFPSWSPRLERAFPWDVFGTCTIDNYLEGSLPDSRYVPNEWEHHSKLISVPKTQKAPRLIASEPVCHQWIQQGIAKLLVERVARSPLGLAIDFHSQEPSRRDALESSRTGMRSTIDLSSASDRLSLRLVEFIFAANQSLLRMFADSRTRYLFNPIDKKNDSVVKLKKFASMGSALTFPVQSIVFTVLAVGVGSYLRRSTNYRKLCKEVRVFGDDIIVPNAWVSELKWVLTHFGLKVNASKTFTEGNFRESCGMDAFRGYDVTPAYVRSLSTELTSDNAVGYVAVVNNFFLKGYWHTAAYLESAAPWVSRLPAVAAHIAALGRATFSRGLDPSLRVSWDHKLQKEVVSLLRVKTPKALTSSHERRNGMMEYSVQSKHNGYSWSDRLSPVEHYFSIAEMIERSPDRRRACLRREKIPTELLTLPA